jgi:hypothetical protein
MRRRLQKMVSASSSIASGHAAYASRRRPSIGGSRTWLPARSYADGSGMTRADGSSSAGDTRLSSPIKLNSSARFGRSRETIRSRSSLRLATSCITRPSFSGTFLQVEPAHCRLSLPNAPRLVTLVIWTPNDRSQQNARPPSHPTPGSAILSVAAVVCLTQEGLVASKRARRTKRRTWSKVDVREKAHSRSKSPVKKIAKAMRRTVGALRQKALSLGLPLGACLRNMSEH